MRSSQHSVKHTLGEEDADGIIDIDDDSGDSTRTALHRRAPPFQVPHPARGRGAAQCRQHRPGRHRRHPPALWESFSATVTRPRTRLSTGFGGRSQLTRRAPPNLRRGHALLVRRNPRPSWSRGRQPLDVSCSRRSAASSESTARARAPTSRLWASSSLSGFGGATHKPESRGARHERNHFGTRFLR